MDDLANADEDPRAIVLIPVAAMMVVIVELVVLVLTVPKPILIVIPLVSAPIICSQLTGCSQKKRRKESGHCQQYSAVLPRHYIFHRPQDNGFHEP